MLQLPDFLHAYAEKLLSTNIAPNVIGDGDKIKVLDRSKVHVSSRSLIQCVAVVSFQTSSSRIAMTFERKPVT